MKAKLEALESRLLLASASLVAGTLTIGSGSLNDTITVVINGANYNIDVNESGVLTEYNGFTVASVLAFNVQPGSGNDTVNMAAANVPVVCFGGNGHDTITGGNSNDTLQGGNGDDSINGDDGADRLDGGLNSDTLIGGNGNDTADYSGRTAAITADLDGVEDDGEAGESDRIAVDVESIMGGSGNDLLTGDGDGNYLSGGSGNDTLAGGLGNDILHGGAGVDGLYGNDGADAIFALDGEIDVVDGGPGVDSAQTDPAEGAPVPGEDVIIPVSSDPLASFVGPVYSAEYTASLFSRQPVKRSAPLRRPTTARTVAVSAEPVLAPSSPVPGGPGGFGGDEPVGIESPITQQYIDQVLTPLLVPYTLGQVLVTRRFQGQVTIGGTTGNDEISVQTFGTQAGQAVEIMVNGGPTSFVLPTPTLTLANRTGEDVVSVIGSRSEFEVTFAPNPQAPDQGQITIDGHQIIYGQPGVAGPSFEFTALREFTLVTPQAADLIQIGSVDPNNPNSPATGITAYSGQFALPAIQLTAVSLLSLDLATNEPSTGVDDQVVVNSLPQGAPDLALFTKNYPSGAGGGNDRLIVGGIVDLANNPVVYEGVTRANVNVEVLGGGNIRFLSRVTELASLKLAANANATLSSGDQTLFVHGLNMVAGAGGSTLNLEDGNLIVDHDGSAAAVNLIRQLITNAYNPTAATHWNAPGITSYAAPVNPATALGYGESAAILGPDGGSFRGVNNVDGTATLVSFTLLGDANLDRKVNFADLVALAQSYQLNPGTQVWERGDFNYDRSTNFADLVLMAQNYGRSLFT